MRRYRCWPASRKCPAVLDKRTLVSTSAPKTRIVSNGGAFGVAVAGGSAVGGGWKLDKATRDKRVAAAAYKEAKELSEASNPTPGNTPPPGR